MDNQTLQLKLNDTEDLPHSNRRKPIIKLKISNSILKQQLFKPKISKPTIRDGQHICPYCPKGFGSGKALGGHIRIHALKNSRKKTSKVRKRDLISDEDEEENVDQDEDGKISCYICKKDFRSLKSLFGHMRNHPDRGWRGIRPPTTPQKNNSFGGSSQNGGSEEEEFSFGNDDVEEPNSGSDLLNSLPRCSNSVKRIGPDEVVEAAWTLMMIAEDKTEMNEEEEEEADYDEKDEYCYPKNEAFVFGADQLNTFCSETLFDSERVHQRGQGSGCKGLDIDLNELPDNEALTAGT